MFEGGLYISKSRYLGVAELDDGEEIYLEMERHYDSYYIIGKRGSFNY